MKTYTLKKDSWHYWLASFGDDLRMYHVNDICAYIRAMIFGLFHLIFVTAIICLLGGGMLFSIGNLFGWLFLGYKLYEITVIFTTVFVAVITVLIIAVIVAFTKERTNNTEPGFVRLAYRRVKEKTCSLVEFE